jgi:carboxylesterase type B
MKPGTLKESHRSSRGEVNVRKLLPLLVLACKLLSGQNAQPPEPAFVLSKQISTAWVSFARTGNPNHDGLPQWPKYTAEQRATMYFDTPCEVLNDPEGDGLRLIASS